MKTADRIPKSISEMYEELKKLFPIQELEISNTGSLEQPSPYEYVDMASESSAPVTIPNTRVE